MVEMNYIKIDNKTHLVFKSTLEKLTEFMKLTIESDKLTTTDDWYNACIEYIIRYHSPHQVGDTVTRECPKCKGKHKSYTKASPFPNKCPFCHRGKQSYVILSISLKQAGEIVKVLESRSKKYDEFNDWLRATTKQSIYWKDWLLLAEIDNTMAGKND